MKKNINFNLIFFIIFLLIVFFQINVNIAFAITTPNDCGDTPDTQNHTCIDIDCSNFNKYSCKKEHCSGGNNRMCCISSANILGDFKCTDIGITVRYDCFSDLCAGPESIKCCPINTKEQNFKEMNPKTNSDTTVELSNPLGETKEFPVLFGNIIKYILGIIGSLALIMFIYGGAIWMLSAGNQEMIKKGKDTLIWASFGIAIIFTAYAIILFIINTIAG